MAEQLLQEGLIRNTSAVAVCRTLEKRFVSQGAQFGLDHAISRAF